MKKYLNLLSPALGIGLLSLALWVLSKELGNYDF